MASILANTILSVAGRAIGLIVGIIVTALLSRTLGVEQFGYFSLVLSLGAILHVVTDLGLYLTLTREIAQHPQEEQSLLAHATTLRTVVFGVVFVLGALWLWLLPKYHGLLPLYGVAALGFWFQSLSQLLMGVFQKHAVMWRATVGDIVGRLAQLLVVILLAFGFFFAVDQHLLLAVAAFTIGAALAYLMHALLVPSVSVWRLQVSLPLWRRLLATSWPLGLMLVLNAIYFRIDMVLLAHFRSPAEVGWYGLAYRIVESALFFPAAFGGLLLPKLSQDRSVDQLITQGVYVMTVVGGLVYVVLAGLSEPLVVFLAGQDFAPAGVLLAVLAAALVIMFFGNVFGFALVALGEQRMLLRLYACLAVGNLIANLLLIPRFGTLAAAWTTVGTEAIATLTAAWLVRRRVAYTIEPRVVYIVVGIGFVVAMLLNMISAGIHVIPATVLASGVYIGLAALFGLLQRRHINLLLRT